MTRLRALAFLFLATAYTVLGARAQGGTWYCETDCGTSTSCDYQCIDGGGVTTCGQYNGGYGNGMCSGVPICSITETYSNSDRYVYGPVDAECAWRHPFNYIDHSPPWSNFGVVTAFSGRQDSDQFKGWKDLGESTIQWNACTSYWFGSPIRDYFNGGQGWGDRFQYSLDEKVYAVRYRTLPGTCVSNLSGPYTVEETYMDIWDLDGTWLPWPDEKLGRISYSAANLASQSCDTGTDTCWGETGWLSPSDTPAEFTGKIKVGVLAVGGMGQP